MKRLTFVWILVFALVAMLGVARGANAQVVLCVGCTSSGQFEWAGWQAVGTSFVGERKVLAVNPETGLSRWVVLTHLPPGGHINAIPLRPVVPPVAVQTGTAVALQSNPFSAIVVAGAGETAAAFASTQASVGLSATTSAVSGSEQIAINVAIQVTRKTYFVRLDPSTFASYRGSLQVFIAHQNFNALQNLGIGWPVTGFSSGWWKALTSALKLYTGHSFMVCDIFGNGDSACFVPNPFDWNVLTQDGPAKDADGNVLSDLANRVAGGGGDGVAVQRTWSPSLVTYHSSGGGGSGIRCGYVNGVLSGCVKVE